MRTPRLSRALVLEAPLRSADAAGGFTETWEPLGVLWAELRTGSGRDRAGQGAALGSLTHRIAVRGAPQGAPGRPVPGQRFREGARIFAILAVSEADASGRYLTCFAREEVTR